MRKVFLIALVLSAAPAGAVDPATFKNFAFRQHPGAELPLESQMIDAQARPVTLAAALGGKPTIFVLEYLRCNNLCSLVLNGAVQAISNAGLAPERNVNLVALSIDPRDTAQDAARAQAMYARSFPVAERSGVRFFTSSADQVRRIAEAVGFPYRYDRQSGQFMHPAGFVVLTPKGRISRYMLGLNPDPSVLRKAVAEAGLNQVEPAAHPLLCLCFGYDPDEGSAAALTWQLVRWASAATVLACALLIGLLSLRRKRTD